MGNHNMGEAAGVAENQGLECFERNNPLIFSGGYNPNGAQNWMMEIEKIF